jgi:hypothetical protein
LTGILDLLAKEEGQNGSNLNLGENQSVPFMIVFSDLPDNLQNFTVVVEGYDKKP